MKKRFLSISMVLILALTSFSLDVFAKQEEVHETDMISTLVSHELAEDELIKMQAYREQEAIVRRKRSLYSTDALVADEVQLNSALQDSGVQTIILTSNLTLTDTSVLPNNRTVTITSSAGNQFIITSANKRHFAVGAGSDVTFKRITLDGAGALGGIIVDSAIEKSMLTLDSVTIRRCIAPDNVLGGAINMQGSASVQGEVRITGESEILENTAYWGGGISMRYGKLIVEGNTVFERNSLHQGGGGGIFLFVSPAEIRGNTKFIGNGRMDNVRQQPGGAIFVYTNQPLIISGEVLFEGNVGQDGGAICAGYNDSSYAYLSAVSISDNVVFKENIASRNGGAISTLSRNSVINVGSDQQSKIQFLSNTSNYGHGGGAIYSWYATINIGADTLFDGNRTATLSGAGIYARTSDLNLIGTAERPIELRNGHATSCGGALCLIEGSDVQIEHARMINNYANNFGGAIDIDNSASMSPGTNNVHIRHTVIDGNISNSTGGGIAVEVNTGNLTIDDSVITRNSAGGNPHITAYRTANGNGGGIYFERGSLKINNSRIQDNSSPKSGGGIGIGAPYTHLQNFLESIEIKNTTFIGNSAATLHTLTDPAYTALHASHINSGESKTYSLERPYAYNNFDISYQNDPPVTELPMVTVTFDSLGGAPTPNATTVPIDSGIDRPTADPVKDGFLFKGWVNDVGKAWGFNATPGDPLTGAPVRRNMTLHAQWEENTATGSAELQKQDAENPNIYLQNAKFDLYRINTVTGERKKIRSETTDQNGKINLSNLAVGNYSWIETLAPQGYTLDSTEIPFTVAEGETSTVTVKNRRSLVPPMLNGSDHFAYIVGYQDGTVRPHNHITRAEISTIFFRMLQSDIRNVNRTDSNAFVDVEASQWFNQSISTMSKLGIITGYPDKQFKPNNSITRAEFATIAARFDSSEDITAPSYPDTIGHWAEREIQIATQNGWVTGYEDGTFRPNQKITRAEAMTIINRVLQRIAESKEDMLPNMTQWPDNIDTDMWYYLAVQEATNSHDYSRKDNGYESWTALRETPDWSKQ